jgi:hypothetical protein
MPDAKQGINGLAGFGPAITHITQHNKPVGVVVKSGTLQALLQRTVGPVNIAHHKRSHHSSN